MSNRQITKIEPNYTEAKSRYIRYPDKNETYLVTDEGLKRVHSDLDTVKERERLLECYNNGEDAYYLAQTLSGPKDE